MTNEACSVPDTTMRTPICNLGRSKFDWQLACLTTFGIFFFVACGTSRLEQSSHGKLQCASKIKWSNIQLKITQEHDATDPTTALQRQAQQQRLLLHPTP
eukprot:m.241253 g.241253  ORF g.241253 m.241253 type:complete len:100 (+) comp15320_c1_seq2:366-665(+)